MIDSPLHRLMAAAAFALLPVATAHAQAEPSDPHPRLFLDERVVAAWRDLAGRSGTTVAAAVRRCDEIARSPSNFRRDIYMGFDWAQHLQACLVAWKATDDTRYAKMAQTYFVALIDDLKEVGDGQGGDRAVQRDSGYAIRAHGPYAAIAYDWLAGAGLIDETTRARARQRFKAWTDWYAAKGYRARHPGNNYHAGYFFSATLIAIAQGSEAGPEGTRFWRLVVDQMFGREMLPAARDGLLVGGDWGEGWQYAPLSVASYSLAARAIAKYGVDVRPLDAWLDDVALRHLHARTPGGADTFVGGDTQSTTPYIGARLETLAAVVAGRASPQAKGWMQAEIERLGLRTSASGFVIFPALAEAERVEAVPYDREPRPTEFLARGTSVLYARSSWAPSATWFVAQCSKTIDVDHMPAAAGNFVLSRGNDHAIVDPSPYGSLSSLTSNAPAIDTANLPPNYLPSQGYWSRATGFAWGVRLAGGELLARCDYSDQFRFREVASDVVPALRDFVWLPHAASSGDESAVLLVIDRARGRAPGSQMHLRFRTLASLGRIAEGSYEGAVGGTKLAIRVLDAPGATPDMRAQPAGTCFDKTRNYARGNCDAARFAVNELRQRMPAADARAAHLIAVGPKDGHDVRVAPLPGLRGANGWRVETGGRRWLVTAATTTGALGYEAAVEPGLHVVLPGENGVTGRVSARRAGAKCEVSVAPGTGATAGTGPLLFELGEGCAVRAVQGRGLLGPARR
ncbi:MAG: hypothetical protein IPJ28_08640 [Betaproteobacteria bacterium]|nr:hypothetical protein [Betaproteobacteria bacterium]